MQTVPRHVRRRVVRPRWFLILLVMLAPRLPAQTAPDGELWKKMTPDNRASYILGWKTGASYGAMGEAVAIMEATDSATRARIPWATLGPKFSHAFDRPLSLPQYIAGLDAFYDDYRNQRIVLMVALMVVHDHITGRRTWSEEDLVRMRRSAAGGK